MGLTYTGPSGLFTHLGALAARVNSYGGLASATLPADLTALLTAFGLTWLPQEGIASTYEGFKAQVTAWRQTLAAQADRRLLDPATVLTPLGLDAAAGLDQLLPALLRQLALDAQTVKACTCAAGPVAAVAGNAGNGQAAVTTVLDGYSAPLAGGPASYLYAGRATELCVPSETMTLECVADSAADGMPEGGELFTWAGAPAWPDLDYHPEGSGQGPGLQVVNSTSNLLTNGDLETWSGGVPVGWSLDLGTPGTHLLQDGASWRGSSAAKLVGDGASPIQLSQALSPGLFNGRRRYHVGLAVKANLPALSPGPAGLPLLFGGLMPPSQYGPATLRVSLQGTGYTVTGESLDLPVPNLSLNYSLYFFFVQAPAPLPADWKLVVRLDNLGAGAAVWVDSLDVAPATYHGGVGVALAAGSQPFLRGDRLTFGVTNDGAGKLQTFFRQHYKAQLPSVLAETPEGTFLTLALLGLVGQAAETIPDTLVS